jgi:hypothetical protein
LAVVGKVVLVFIADDLGRECGGEQGAGYAGLRCWGDDGGKSFLGLVDVFFADGAPPEDFGFGDVELVAMFCADEFPVIGGV